MKGCEGDGVPNPDRKGAAMVRDDDLQAFFQRDAGWGEWSFADLEGNYIGAGYREASDFIARNLAFTVVGGRREFGARVFIHLAVQARRDWKANHSDVEPRWREKQRIKNELFGCDAVAIEVFPRQDEVETAGDWYHLWIVPPEFIRPSLLPARERHG